MEYLVIGLFALGALLMTVGHFWGIFKGFQIGVLWGIFLFFCGIPAAILFCLFHREEGTKPLFTAVLGFVLIVGSVSAYAMTHEQFRQALVGGKTEERVEGAAAQEAELEEGEALLPEGDLAVAREMVMQAETDLALATTQAKQAHTQLAATKAALKPNDEIAVKAYNKQVEAYTTQKVILDGKRAKLAAMQKEFEKMIDANPRGGGGTTTASAPAASSAGVIIYTTKSCPHCVTAKNYFSSRHIPYREVDVESSPAARQEWQKLNAQGVPVIVVKGEVIHGFNQARIEQLLGGNA